MVEMLVNILNPLLLVVTYRFVWQFFYHLKCLKSHRTSNDKELIRWDADYGKIEGVVQKRYGSLPIELTVSKKGKKGKINHLEQTKLSNYIGQMNVVMFAPEDLNVVKGSPQIRRRFIDMEIGQISPIYLHDLLKFQKILKQRNSLLKANQGRQTFANDVMFDVYTEQYVQAAVQVIQKRFKFMDLLQEWAEPIHFGISRSLEKLIIKYKTVNGLEKTWSQEESFSHRGYRCDGLGWLAGTVEAARQIRGRHLGATQPEEHRETETDRGQSQGRLG